MKNIKNIYIIGSIISIIILLLFLFQKPTKEYIKVKVPVRVEVPIPSVDNDFEPIAPKPIYVKNKVNTELLNKYNKAKDSLEKLKLYTESITQRKYKEVFEDSIQTITVNAKTTGTLDSLQLSYITKPRTIKYDTIITTQVKIPKKIELYGLLEMGGNFTAGNNVAKGTFIIKNKKDRLISASFDSNKNILIGYGFKF